MKAPLVKAPSPAEEVSMPSRLPGSSPCNLPIQDSQQEQQIRVTVQLGICTFQEKNRILGFPCLKAANYSTKLNCRLFINCTRIPRGLLKGQRNWMLLIHRALWFSLVSSRSWMIMNCFRLAEVGKIKVERWLHTGNPNIELLFNQEKKKPKSPADCFVTVLSVSFRK